MFVSAANDSSQSDVPNTHDPFGLPADTWPLVIDGGSICWSCVLGQGVHQGSGKLFAYDKSEMTQLRRSIIDAGNRAAPIGFDGSALNFLLPMGAASVLSYGNAAPTGDLELHGTVWKEAVKLRDQVNGEEMFCREFEYDGDRFCDCGHPDYVFVRKSMKGGSCEEFLRSFACCH